jgi:hypothetical protein
MRSVPSLYDVLSGLDIPILSVGFSGEKENFDVLSQGSLEKHGKKLSGGSSQISVLKTKNSY